jgi:O-glycosyl hydrolase
MIRKLILTIALGLFIGATVWTVAFGTDGSRGAGLTGRPVTFYVTAKDTGQRLAKAGELHFTGHSQPTEKQQCIFLDASKIHDFNNAAVVWTDWHVLLIQEGGPNRVANYCFAPIIANTKIGEITCMDSYYYPGQFSKFVRPWARRVISSSTDDNLLTTDFLNKDGTIAVIVMILSETEQPFCVWMEGETAKTSSPPRSIMTFVI